MQEVFSKEEREILIATHAAGEGHFLESRDKHAASPQAMLFIGEKRFPTPWTDDSKRRYIDSLHSLIAGKFLTDREEIQSGIFRFRLTPKGESLIDALADSNE